MFKLRPAHPHATPALPAAAALPHPQNCHPDPELAAGQGPASPRLSTLLPKLALAPTLLLALPTHAQTLPATPQPNPTLIAQNTPAPTPQPLTRTEAEQLALRNNPRITESALLALAQHQVVRETRAGELPSLFGNITGVTAVEGSRISSGSLTASRLLNHAGGGVSLSQLITDFGRTRNLVATSSLQARAADQSALATREEIVLAVDLAFYNALEAQATLKVAQGTVAARSDVNQQVSALTASNLKSSLDLSFSQVNLSQAQLLVLDAQNQTEAAMASLDEVLGETAPHIYTLIDDTIPAPPVPPAPEPVIAQALQQRPDLAAFRLSHEADVRFAHAQREQLLPTVSALGIVGGTPYGENPPGNTYFPQPWYGAAGVNLSVPIFNGFRFQAQAEEAAYRAQASDQRSRQLTDRIVRDVRTAWLTATTAQQRMAVTRQLVTQANTALDLAQTRYNLGLSSIVELSQAQLQQTQAEIADANARFQYEADLAALRFQTGTQP